MKTLLFNYGPVGSSKGCRIRPLSAEDRFTHQQQSRAFSPPTAISVPQCRSELSAPRRQAAGAGLANTDTVFADVQPDKFQALFQFLGGGTHLGLGVVFQACTRENGPWLSLGEEWGLPFGRTRSPFVRYLGLLHWKYHRKREKKDLN